MPRYACSCFLEIWRPRKGARCRARWPVLCDLHADDGPDALMLAAAEELAAHGRVSAPSPPPRTRTCIDCDELLAEGSHAKRCPPCKLAHRNRTLRERYIATRVLPDPRPCVQCGANFVPTTSRNQLTCSPECRAARWKEHARISASRRYHERQAAARAANRP